MERFQICSRLTGDDWHKGGIALVSVDGGRRVSGSGGQIKDGKIGGTSTDQLFRLGTLPGFVNFAHLMLDAFGVCIGRERERIVSLL